MSGKAAAVPPAATPAAAGDHAGFCCHCANSLEEWAEVLAQAEEDGDDEVELLVCSDCKRTMCERCFNYDDDRRCAQGRPGEEAQGGVGSTRAPVVVCAWAGPGHALSRVGAVLGDVYPSTAGLP